MSERLLQMSGDELRAKAAKNRQDAQDSFDRCDTDGFLSQWASGISAQLYDKQAAIADAGGKWDFWGLFRASDGKRIRAKQVSVYNKFKYGYETRWCVVDANDRAVAWFPCNWGSGKGRKLKAAGLYEAMEEAPAKAKIMGSGTGLSGAANAFVGVVRMDKGYPDDAVDL